jgi:asparagine N-glycosylation enzyme membrane subunit Stt3
MMNSADQKREGARIGAMLGLFVAAVAVRALPAPTVLLGDRVQPFGGDAFYHLRRIAYSIEQFPRVLEFDRYLNFPAGAMAIWTPVFDWLIAALAVALRAEPASLEMERIAVWVPPVLGAATVVVLYRLAARTFGEPTGLAAGLLLCISSAHFWYSQIGFVDHHVAVAFITTVLLGRAMLFMDAAPETASAWPLGLALGAALWIWPGTLLHVGIIETALFIMLCADSDGGPAAAARRFANVQWVALLVVLPSGASSQWPQWGAFSPVVLSLFQPWLFSALALLGFGCSALWRRTGYGGSPIGRVLSGAAIGVGLLVASLLAIPGLWIGGQDAWQWFGKAETFQALVSESLPLLQLDGAFSTEVATSRLSYFVFLSPIALVWAATSAWRDERWRGKLLLVGWTAVLLAATLWQKRFFNTSSVGLALLMAWTLAGVHRAWTVRVSGHRWLANGVVVSIAALLLAPSIATYRGFLPNLRGDQVIAGSHLQLAHNVAIATSDYLRRETPRTSGWLDSEASPEYSVMSPWPIGHVIEYVGRRPTVTDGFGDDLGPENFERASRYYSAAESEALEIAEKLGVRYVIAQRSAQFLGREPGVESMLTALFIRDGSERVASQRVRAPQPALQRHRLIYESAPPGRRSRARESLFKLFEIVDGAEVVGRATPGAQVRAVVELVTNRKREFLHLTTTLVGDDGSYSLRVPYANEDPNQRAVGVVRVAPHYTITCGNEKLAIRVTERDIRSGATLTVPELDCPAHTTDRDRSMRSPTQPMLRVRMANLD